LTKRACIAGVAASADGLLGAAAGLAEDRSGRKKPKSSFSEPYHLRRR